MILLCLLAIYFKIEIFKKNKSTYFNVLSSLQDFHFLKDAVNLFTDSHFDVFLKYSF